MERAEKRESVGRKDRIRQLLILLGVITLHATIFIFLSQKTDQKITAPPPPISVKLIVAEPDPTPKPTAPEPKRPEAIPERLQNAPKPPEPKEEEELTPPVINVEPSEPRAVLEPLSDTTADPSSTLPVARPEIDERWRLPDGANIPIGKTEQPRNPNLAKLGQALDCFGFDADCAIQRKEIFAKEQLSETDLVWMRSYAHSGLSDSSLYGLSEAQIRERLGIPTAGRNGLLIFPGIGIDGPWWDKLHGVNKACSYGVGIGAGGQRELKKSCAKLKPSSKDKIGFKPKSLD